MIKNRNIAICIILSIVTCGIYSIVWFFSINDEVNIASHNDSPSAIVAFLLTIVTCGIYGLYWFYCIGQRLEQVRSEQGLPAGSLHLIFLLLSIFGFGIVSYAIAQNELNRISNV